MSLPLVNVKTWSGYQIVAAMEECLADRKSEGKWEQPFGMDCEIAARLTALARKGLSAPDTTSIREEAVLEERAKWMKALDEMEVRLRATTDLEKP